MQKVAAVTETLNLDQRLMRGVITTEQWMQERHDKSSEVVPCLLCAMKICEWQKAAANDKQ